MAIPQFDVSRGLASRLILNRYALRPTTWIRNVSRGLASRLRLKLCHDIFSCRGEEGLKGPGISSEIETPMDLRMGKGSCRVKGPVVSSKIVNRERNRDEGRE